MNIGGISTFNGYSAHGQSQTTREPQSAGPGPVTPAHAAKEPKSADNGTPDTQNAVGLENQKAEHDKSESPGTRHASGKLSEEDQQKVQELKQRDREVRAHEAAHLAAAGRYATGSASFEYEHGPDGKSYAVGGEVGLNTSPVPNDPQATLQKARVIKAAALAPADPSTTDRKVAADAARMEAEAIREISRERTEERSPGGNTNNEPDATEPDKENEGSTGNRYTAASTYKAVDEMVRSDVNGVSRIELTA